MQFSIAKDIFGSPWHIDASGIQQYFPVVTGILNGALISPEAEPKENIPKAYSVRTLSPVQWSEDETGDDSVNEPQREKVVHVLPVRGVMMKHDMTCGPRGTRTLANRLLNADADKSVIGHIMIFEGPGGAANAVPEIADAMKQCTKPILGWVDGIAASAHQYVLSYSDEKWASRATDILGSIGTMMVFKGRISKSDEDLFKEREVTIYADDAFEKNEEYEKAINDFDFKLSKERVLNPHNQQFINDIKTNCPGVGDEHLHGRTFSAGEVIGSLIDKIGSFEDALKRVIEMAGPNTPNTLIINSNKKTMKQFAKLNTVLGVGSLESVDEVVSLNEGQLELVESSFNKTDQAIAGARIAAETERDAANTERDTAITNLRNAVGAFDAIDETVAAAGTPEAKVAAVRNLLAAKPGTPPKGNLDDTDPGAKVNTDANWDIIDNLPHNKAVDINS